jgi:hypothetical protein
MAKLIKYCQNMCKCWWFGEKNFVESLVKSFDAQRSRVKCVFHVCAERSVTNRF